MRLLMHRLRDFNGDEQGQVTAYFIGLSFLLFAILAVSFDLGLLHLQRRAAQNSSDSAAMAGAAYLDRCALAGQDDSPQDIAEQFALRNLTVGSNFTGAEDLVRTAIGSFHVENEAGEADWQTVRARVDREQNYIFGQVMGLVGATVPAEAEATCGPISEGDVCPMYVSGDPDQEPVYGADPDGPGPEQPPLESAYGLVIGQVYSMKDSPDHIGALSAPIGPGTAHWTDFIRAGCESDTGETLQVIEGGEVETKPGNWGNPTSTGLEGGNGSNSDGLYEEELIYETLGYNGPDLFPFGHLDCDLHLTVASDPSIVLEVRKYDANRNPTGSPLTPEEIVEAVNELTNPDDMLGANPAPCGGLRKDGSVVPELVTQSVQGRFMHIVLTNGSCQNRCPLPVLGIMRMYILCWTNQKAQTGNIHPSKLCVPNGGPNDTTIYGVFADFKAPSLLGGGGLGTNPLAPFHVVLVR